MTQRRELVKLIQALANDERMFYIHTVQRRPYTYVMITYTRQPRKSNTAGQLLYGGHGFSKVMRPDKWDAETGRILATNKACVDLAEYIVGHGDVDKVLEDLGKSTVPLNTDDA